MFDEPDSGVDIENVELIAEELNALLDKGTNGMMKADIDLNPSELVFNDTVWNVEKGHIKIDNGVVDVDNIAGGRGNQYIRVNGKISHDPSDELCKMSTSTMCLRL